MDSDVMNKAGRKVIGTGITIRREIMHILADTRTVTNHYLMKTANMVDRVLRAEGTTAQEKLREYINERGSFHTCGGSLQELTQMEEIRTLENNTKNKKCRTKKGENEEQHKITWWIRVVKQYMRRKTIQK